jgi:hypothetical protein
MNLDDPIATALRVARVLEGADIAYGLYGGLAVAAYGVARETKDADVGPPAPGPRPPAPVRGTRYPVPGTRPPARITRRVIRGSG